MDPEGGFGDTPHINWYNRNTEFHIFYESLNPMKNSYNFKNLVKTELPKNSEKNSIFFSMRNISISQEITLTSENFDEIEKELRDENYYIAHNFVRTRGKDYIFSGCIFVVEKNNLISFIKSSINKNDVRDFLASPVFTHEPAQVLRITEDSYYLYNQLNL